MLVHHVAIYANHARNNCRMLYDILFCFVLFCSCVHVWLYLIYDGRLYWIMFSVWEYATSCVVLLLLLYVVSYYVSYYVVKLTLSLYFLLYYYAILQYAIRQGVVCVYEVMLCALCSSTLYYMVFMQFIAWYCNTTMFSIVLHCIALSCIIWSVLISSLLIPYIYTLSYLCYDYYYLYYCVLPYAVVSYIISKCLVLYHILCHVLLCCMIL